ncbi:MAG: hypothetical protein J6W85_04140 [Lachnospiraceae bacterium]|nr:hypothetical protein [Lachnospiraceae bacterium]MBP5701618.1 hypothetical protein [Lachnospiraceae bacterium]MBP5762214.1 hypothetical protein [Lachnospiraceae bacterium]
MMDIFGAVLIIFMTVLSVCDIRMRKLPVVILRAGIALALARPVLFFLVSGPSTEQQRLLSVALLGALPGLTVTALSFISDKVGRGDGIVLIMMGMLENCSFVTTASCIACLTLAVFSGILLALHRVGRNSRMPFVPFLTGAYIVLKLSGGRYGI